MIKAIFLALRRLALAASPRFLRQAVTRSRLGRAAIASGFDLRRHGGVIDVVSGRSILRISARHEVYLGDVASSFYYYFGAVRPASWQGKELVDYSRPRLHEVVGFDDFPILFPSFCEPIATAQQYLNFAALSSGMTVLDLGAYSGLTAILFAQHVMPGGRVIAVDADHLNVSCIEQNLAAYKRHSGHHIDFMHTAVWNHERGLRFSGEGNMGSSAAGIVGRDRGELPQVASTTLSGIVRRFKVNRVDFIKCDIEGAERLAFNDAEFFERFQPRIIIEAHLVEGVETTADCAAALAQHGYRCKRVSQHGVEFPLLECLPPGAV
jgi:FkbM family methyltransferase